MVALRQGGEIQLPGSLPSGLTVGPGALGSALRQLGSELSALTFLFRRLSSETARAAISAGVNQYPPGLGMPVLREAIAAHQKRFYGIEVDAATQVLVTAGATEAIAATLLALTDIGDEVVTFEPFYDEYGDITALGRATQVTVPLRAPHFLPDLDELRAAVNDRTRVILVNSPHNPTGVVFPREILELIVELAHRHDAIIVTDEVYEHLTFGVEHVPVASLPGAFERTVTISSGGKTFSTTGWKIGWAIAPAELIQAITAVKQYLTYVKKFNKNKIPDGCPGLQTINLIK